MNKDTVKTHRPRRYYIKKAFAAFFAASVLSVILLWICNPPPLAEAQVFPEGFVLRAADGEIIRVGLGPDDIDCRPTYVPNREDWIVKAIVAAEDSSFFEHHGIRLSAVLRAIRQNLTTMRKVSGASTITMQTVRLIKPHKRTFLDKLFETFKAIRLEQSMTKDEILRQYLNRSPFGSNLVGIEAAAQVWFGRKASELSLAEAALLAGLPQAPSRFRPDRHFDRALKRRAYVFDRMEALGLITAEERAAAENVELQVHPNRRPFKHPWFCDWTCGHEDVHGDMTTSLNQNLQSEIDHILGAADISPLTTYAAVVISVKDGSVLAMTSTGDYFERGDGQLNAAALPRLAGSTLKPLAFAMLADRGGLTPELVLPDVPRTFGTYRPKNFAGDYRGLVTAREALVLSLNMPALSVVNEIGVRDFAEKLRSFGFATVDDDTSRLGLGIVLGSVSVRLVDLAAAYASVARSGVYLPPRAFKPENGKNAACKQAFSEGACWMITDILSGEERSLAALGHVGDVKVPRFAWKTGTSAGFRDAWTVAWNPEYAVAVWCGSKTGQPESASRTGLDTAAPIAWRIIRALYPSGDSPWFERPASVKTRKVCALSGKAASPLCPETVDDAYIENTTLWTPCNVHVREPDGTVAEKWPSQIQSGLNAIGKTAVAAAPDLRIISPADGTRYRYFDGIDAAQTAVIKLSGAEQEEKIYWFLNGRHHATTSGNTPLVLPLSRGTFAVTVSTESGESDQVTLVVE